MTQRATTEQDSRSAGPQAAMADDSEARMDPKPEIMPRFRGSGRLAGKVAIVTGGDSGIGRATAVLFAREGAKVAIVYHEHDQDAQRTLALVEDERSEGVVLKGDVAQSAFCKSAVSAVVDRYGRLDCLVNNAAEQHLRTDLEDISEEQLERTFRTNIFGCFFMAQAALPHLSEGASIINTASITAYRGNKTLLDYSSTKGAIVSFTRSLAANLAPRGIRVNAVAPGPIWTPLIPSTFPEDRVKSFGKDTPLGRPGQPNEVAPAFLFLASEDASYMTGQVLHPNGGQPVGS